MVFLYYTSFFFYCSRALRDLHSFPTRRSSDPLRQHDQRLADGRAPGPSRRERGGDDRDRKSTRLNSSHQIISYAVFCLKKKKKKIINPIITTIHLQYDTHTILSYNHRYIIISL